MSLRDRTIRAYIKNVESQKKPSSVISVVSSVGSDGKSLNSQVNSDYESRSQLLVLPYGISSSGKAKMRAQTIFNNDGHDAVVGVYDPNRPKPEPGQLILYSSGGAEIKLNTDGTVVINGIDINTIANRVTELEQDVATLQQEVLTLQGMAHTH